MTDSELHRLRQESLLLRSLVTELCVQMTNRDGGYGEIAIRRMTLAADRWEITDGANRKRRVWLDSRWQLAEDVGLAAAHVYSLDEALDVAQQVAEFEGATFEAWVLATRDVT